MVGHDTNDKKKVCIYAHYDSHNIIKPYVTFCLEEFKKMGMKIYFVTTSDLCNRERLKLSSDLIDHYICRKNIGYDFYSWKLVIDEIQDSFGEIEVLTLVNSSIFGPIFGFAHFFDEFRDCDFWGLNDSYEYTYHIQSYLLCFNSRLLVSHDFIDFWKKVEALSDKLKVIKKYELKLAKFFINKGYKGRVIYHVKRRLLFNPNPSLAMPDRLLMSGVPFLKVRLFYDNPWKADVITLKKMIEGKYNLNLLFGG